ncbi:MAG: DMT family transporter [Rhizobiales bacterium]|nr:DMT family transporter [Hyphomicrobiales bacterium]
MATFLGFNAILLWSLLALLTAASGTMPPFQLSAITFAIGTLVGLAALIRMGTSLAVFRQPLPVWLLGIGGLFGYHFFYYTALRNAPPIEAGLIAYLWPLLIVVFSALLPGERLRWFHVAGAAMGLIGTIVLVTRGGGFSFDPRYLPGYGASLVCALTWSSYSLLSRRYAAVPTDLVTAFCAATAALSLACHLALEQTVWPETGGQWLAIVGLGLGPVGAAFYLWDIGMKKGRIQVLGACSYAAPLLSTLILIAAGFGEPTWRVGLACLLITGGALLASKELFSK